MARASTKSSAARALAIAWALLVSACASPAPDTILFNGRIFTANAAQPWAEAVALRGDRVVAVGSAAQIAAQVGDAGRRIDLDGRTVVPGLIAAYVPVDALDANAVRALAAAAHARGITSMQVFSSPPVAEVASAFVAAASSLRVRLFRKPVPDVTGEHRDSRPHFPPQPSPRLDVRGMAFDLSPADAARLDQVVGWAYGSEDPLSIRCRDATVLAAYLAAIERRGAAEVWRDKRPRVEGPVVIPPALLPRLAKNGVVVVQSPGDASLKSLTSGGVQTALAAGHASPFDAVRWAIAEAAPGERITREEAVRLMTDGAAYAEFAEGAKGTITVGALADLAVLSADVFTLPEDKLSSIHSVLTMIGGQPVYDAGLWRP